ncbi:L-rhamnose mutarotase [Catenuloplanes japonicus]|uniref:L-rhamnose mutarotase n=1 Tax=Catenuloplanes japonicus TaxID=33876 RepID=UPI00052603D0|nr:L-rhamnose mutarotase [Catenuloplanes japonicus]
MRIALHSVVQPGTAEEYLRLHARVPDDLLPAFARAGIHDWTIWRSGERLFHLVDCDDWDAAVAVLDTEPANAAWQRTIGRVVREFHGPDGKPAFAPLAEVWQLTDQLNT